MFHNSDLEIKSHLGLWHQRYVVVTKQFIQYFTNNMKDEKLGQMNIATLDVKHSMRDTEFEIEGPEGIVLFRAGMLVWYLDFFSSRLLLIKN